ncbi:hypothetical protein [Streptomyces tsukubensis]|uniref:Uncharacterized protein n=1 Tax=Streptomyces tsukubensis TaxID=83656 RepID=A0A1V4AH81_9ACTN|nr:hypothetical protein B1H18_01840 [Streptomyces tsukubensis]
MISACPAVRAQDTTSPWACKPLLAAAMKGIVPDHLLARTTKDHVTREWHDSLRHRRTVSQGKTLSRRSWTEAGTVRRGRGE